MPVVVQCAECREKRPWAEADQPCPCETAPRPLPLADRLAAALESLQAHVAAKDQQIAALRAVLAAAAQAIKDGRGSTVLGMIGRQLDGCDVLDCAG